MFGTTEGLNFDATAHCDPWGRSGWLSRCSPRSSAWARLRFAGADGGWGHVWLFLPWRYTVDTAARALLDAQGWQSPEYEALPTGTEIVRDYLTPLGKHPAIAPHLRTGTLVVAITRAGHNKLDSDGRDLAPFVIHWQDAAGQAGRTLARAVIDATGTWGTPNPIGQDGLPVPGEAVNADRIAYGIPDVKGTGQDVYAGRHGTAELAMILWPRGSCNWFCRKPGSAQFHKTLLQAAAAGLPRKPPLRAADAMPKQKRRVTLAAAVPPLHLSPAADRRSERAAGHLGAWPRADPGLGFNLLSDGDPVRPEHGRYRLVGHDGYRGDFAWLAGGGSGGLTDRAVDPPLWRAAPDGGGNGAAGSRSCAYGSVTVATGLSGSLDRAWAWDRGQGFMMPRSRRWGRSMALAPGVRSRN